jgi:flagella basal body P-ring formation protein FlgA
MTGRPLPTRSRIRLTIALMILAWATQLLLHQWGYGAEAQSAAGAERFVAPAASGAAAVLELRDEATVYGTEVRLKQLFRWSERDAAAAGAVGELVLLRFDANAPYKSISLDEIKTTLRDAGVSLAALRFTGATACTVSRADTQVDQTTALQQWVDAKRGAASDGTNGTARASATPVAPPTRTEINTAEPADTSPVRTLRDLLKADVCQRLSVPADALQITFNPKDEGTLNLAEPQFRFNLTPRRVRDLGTVSWDVAVVGRDNAVRTVSVNADARAWRREVVAAKPLAFKQVIQAEDLEERRVLADRLPPAPLLEQSQIVGQQAARDLKPGTVLNVRLVDPVPLAKTGQLVTVNVAQGAVRIKTVARALEGGSFGETIRVKNDQTRDVYTVVLTGPQEGSVGPPPEPTPAGAKARTPVASAQP